jgi:hypothetical protein
MFERLILDPQLLRMLSQCDNLSDGVGKAVFVEEHYVDSLRDRMNKVAIREDLLSKRQLYEYNLMGVNTYAAKMCLKQEQLLDAHSNIVRALHNWARLDLISEGIEPTDSLWEQMKAFNPEVNKMYEELTFGFDSLQKRIELVIIACEYNFSRRLEESCYYLLRVLATRDEAWGIEELQHHPLLEEMNIKTVYLLHKLANRGFVEERAVIQSIYRPDKVELRYSVKKTAM